MLTLKRYFKIWKKQRNENEIIRNNGICDDCWDTVKMKKDGLI